MRISLAAEMASIDRRAEAEAGLPTRVLMENAGAGVARACLGEGHGPFCVLAGAGNNGGDGLVAARHLDAAGEPVQVVLAAPPEQLSGAAADNRAALLAAGIQVIQWPEEKEAAITAIRQAIVLVDALLGTGLKGAVRPQTAELIGLLNSSPARVVAVDLPSGLMADTGQAPGAAVHADTTITFGTAKPAHLIHPGAGCTGRLIIDPIGIPAAIIRAAASGLAIEAAMVRSRLPRRAPDAHKGNAGRIAVLGGSPGLSGAPRLCARGALRVGAGLVTAGYPGSIAAEMAVRDAEVMGYAMTCGVSGGMTAASLADLPDWLAAADAVAIGPGLGASVEAGEFTLQVLRAHPGAVVVDADALRPFRRGIPPNLNPERMVITPHPGEMARLIGESIQSVQEDRLGIARRVARETGATVVLKGAGTIIALPGGRYFINTTGNPGLAAGGTGDVLAGVIAGLMAQGLNPEDAAVCGVFLHGLSGDELARVRPRGYLAGEVADEIPAAMRKVEQGE